MKVTLTEIKKNLQGINSGGAETEYQINDWKHKEKKNIKSEQQEEKSFNQNSKKKKEFKTNEDRIRSPWDIAKRTNI